LQKLAVDADVVARGVGLEARSGDGLAVDLHVALGDELLGVAAAGNAGVGEDFLQAFLVARGSIRWGNVSSGLFLFFQQLFGDGFLIGIGFEAEIRGECLLRLGGDLLLEFGIDFSFEGLGAGDFEVVDFQIFDRFCNRFNRSVKLFDSQLCSRCGGLSGFLRLRAD
jgi:hypothetical protein